MWPAGDIDYRHAFLDMSSITVAASNSHARGGHLPGGHGLQLCCWNH